MTEWCSSKLHYLIFLPEQPCFGTNVNIVIKLWMIHETKWPRACIFVTNVHKHLPFKIGVRGCNETSLGLFPQLRWKNWSFRANYCLIVKAWNHSMNLRSHSTQMHDLFFAFDCNMEKSYFSDFIALSTLYVKYEIHNQINLIPNQNSYDSFLGWFEDLTEKHMVWSRQGRI